MKTITIVGLGLIGASYAEGLSKKGYTIYGVDTNIETLEYALSKKMIVEGSKELADFLPKSDIIIFAIYPQLILNMLKKYHFNEKQIITDVCGIKMEYLEEATKLVLPANYCSHHPMAGKEKVGIKFADANIFKGANFLITPTLDTKEYSIEVIKKLGEDLGFGNIRLVDPVYHDKMIGFTSTLTHAIAVGLVNSDHFIDTKEFIGDSYRDLTRIAMINEKLWIELFFANKNNLIEHLENFENEINKIKKALINDDKNLLEDSFKKATRIRRGMDKKCL